MDKIDIAYLRVSQMLNEQDVKIKEYSHEWESHQEAEEWGVKRGLERALGVIERQSKYKIGSDPFNTELDNQR